MSSEGEKAASASAVEAHASSSDGKRKAAPQQQQQPCRKKKTILYDTPEQMYGVSVTNDRVVDVCAGCLGSRNVELRDNPIVLCDGEGCGREYHLQCCLPPLSLEEIPEGSYLCIDCDPDGASSQLETYFEHQWEARSKFKTRYARWKEGCLVHNAAWILIHPVSVENTFHLSLTRMK